MRLFLLILMSLLIFSSCSFLDFKKQSDKKFADQHFKTAISQIELYNIRYGHYPESLDSLTYLGDWDRIMYSSVSYEKLDTGYRLDLTGSLFNSAELDLDYPADFWHGLGLKKSNLLKSNP